MSKKQAKLDLHYEYIDTDDKLDAALSILVTKKILGVDVESNPHKVTLLDLALIQIGDEQVQFLFDPFTITLSKLVPLFENPAITKVFFSGNQDLLILKHNLQCEIQSFFDIQTAYLWVSGKFTGLAGLISEFFDVTISKEEQTSKWQNRPLTVSMLSYAATDVLYLPLLYTIIYPSLVEKNLVPRITLLFESTRFMHSIDEEIINQTAFLSIEGFKSFSDEGKLVAKRLFGIRSFFHPYLTTKLISSIAKTMPNSVTELQETVNEKKFTKKDLKNILQVISKSSYDITETELYYNEVGRFMKLGRSNFDLLNPDLTPKFEISIDEFVMNYTRLREWLKTKRTDSIISRDYFIPNLILRQLATYNFTKVQQEELFTNILNQLDENLQKELKFLLQYKEKEFFENFLKFVKDSRNEYPSSFHIITNFSSSFNSFNTLKIHLEKGARYELIANLFDNSYTIVFVLNKDLFDCTTFLVTIDLENPFTIREKEKSIFIESTFKSTEKSFLKLNDLLEKLLNLTKIYNNYKKL